jgi:ATP-dependent DNA helicase PIF1
MSSHLGKRKTKEEEEKDINPRPIKIEKAELEELFGDIDSDEEKEEEKKNEIKWTPKQQQVVNAVSNKKGGCVFVSGPAGSGKSFLAMHLMKNVLPPGPRVLVTATTGAAAVLIGGSTIHSAFGLAMMDKKKPKELLRFWNLRKKTVPYYQLLLQTLEEVDSVYIDEVSMLHDKTLDYLDGLLRLIRKCPNVFFGGVRIIAFGDFLQLPPVVKEGETGSWAFKATAWKAFTTQVVLDRVHRQSNNLYIQCLHEMRKGKVTAEAELMFKSRVNAKLNEDEDGIAATELFPMKYQVDDVNNRALARIKDQNEVTFQAKEFVADAPLDGSADTPTKADIRKKALEHLKTNFPGRLDLKLKVGAQVILVKNLNVKDGLCNGAKGVIVKFSDDKKTRGMPIVMFDSGSIETIKHETWKSEDHRGRLIASVSQLPLVLGWAMTIHKAQGSTLSKVRVDISKCRSYGQVYVALSRTPAIEGLSLLPYGASLQPLVKADPEAVAFYERLERGGT